MNIVKKIEKNIDSIKEGKTFTCEQISIDKREYLPATKAVERLIKNLEIK